MHTLKRPPPPHKNTFIYPANNPTFKTSKVENVLQPVKISKIKVTETSPPNDWGQL